MKQIESGEVKAEVVDEDDPWLPKPEHCNIEEVEAPAISLAEKPYATINWKNYTLDSDNSDLLEDVVWGKEKNALADIEAGLSECEKDKLSGNMDEKLYQSDIKDFE